MAKQKARGVCFFSPCSLAAPLRVVLMLTAPARYPGVSSPVLNAMGTHSSFPVISRYSTPGVPLSHGKKSLDIHFFFLFTMSRL